MHGVQSQRRPIFILSAAHKMTCCSLQHCRERPRSMVVIEVFTPVVQRILKHNMVSALGKGTWSLWRSSTVGPFVISSCSIACSEHSTAISEFNPPNCDYKATVCCFINAELIEHLVGLREASKQSHDLRNVSFGSSASICSSSSLPPGSWLLIYSPHAILVVLMV